MPRLTAGANRRKQEPGKHSMTEPTNDNPQLSLGAIIASLPAVKAAKKANTMSRVHRRLIEPIETEQDNEPQLAFQHTVFCQTSLPYRNPGDDVRKWKRTNGSVVLQLEAGDAWNPRIRDFVQLGLPWGTKPRLILAHLNAEALRRDSPVIEVENSLSAFVKRIRGFERRSRNPGIQKPAFPIIGCPCQACDDTRRPSVSGRRKGCHRL